MTGLLCADYQLDTKALSKNCVKEERCGYKFAVARAPEAVDAGLDETYDVFVICQAFRVGLTAALIVIAASYF